jgi:hypothetical protein
MHVPGDSGLTTRSAIGLSLSAAALTVSAFLLATRGHEQQAIQPIASSTIDFDGDLIPDDLDLMPSDYDNDRVPDYNDTTPYNPND